MTHAREPRGSELLPYAHRSVAVRRIKYLAGLICRNRNHTSHVTMHDPLGHIGALNVQVVDSTRQRESAHVVLQPHARELLVIDILAKSEGFLHRPGFVVPQLGGLICAASQKLLSVGAPSERVDGASMSVLDCLVVDRFEELASLAFVSMDLKQVGQERDEKKGREKRRNRHIRTHSKKLG